MEAVLTMWPRSPPAIMRGTNASMPWITPQRLTPSTHCQSRCVAVSSPPQAATPALLQSTWTAPKRRPRPLGQGPDLAQIGDVGPDRQRVDAVAARLAGDALHRGLVEIGDDHPGALAGQGQRQGPADPAAARP